MAQQSRTKNNMPDRMPPQNIEAEQSVLGCLLIDKNAILKVADFLKPIDFYRTSHKSIYEAMVELFARNEPIDFLSVSNRLREKKQLDEIGGTAYLTVLANSVPTATHVSNYAKIVQRKRILRDLIDASHDIATLGYNEEEETDNLLDQAEKRIFSISQHSLTQNFLHVKTSLADAFDRIDQLSKHEGDLRGVRTGFHQLDNILAGLQKSDLIILAARPSIGKSSLALDIARNVAVQEGVPVGIFSLEMSQDQVVDRLLASQSGVNLWKIRTGRLSSDGEDNDFARIQQALGELSEAPIFIDHSPTVNMLQMRSMTRRLQAEYGLGLLIVDYLQLIQPRNSSDSEVQQITEISRSLKALARELNIPVIALSQLSRAVEQRSPQIPRLSDLRQSGCLAADTLITRADTGERIPIKELALRQEQVPIPVMAVNDDYTISPHTMTKVFSSGKKQIFELRTRSGRTIKASANHPFLKVGGWTPLDTLSPGDAIALPRSFVPSSPANPLTEKELILLAHLTGDGCILPRQPFHYTSSDKKSITIVKNAAFDLFGIKGKITKQKNWYHVYLPSPYRLTHGKHHPITKWFQELGIPLAHSWEKHLPRKLFACDNASLALFLKHLWATDGNISWKKLTGRRPACSIYYATSSKNLAEQVQHLLLRLTIRGTLKRVPSRKGYRTMYHVYIQGSEEQLKFLTAVGIADSRQKFIPRFIEALKKIVPNTNIDVIPREIWASIIEPARLSSGIGFREFQEKAGMGYWKGTLFTYGVSRVRASQLATLLPAKPHIAHLATSDIFWDTIEEIVPLGTEEVYDATVEGAHNFVANDIVVHNSIEQDADVVMFIYREDRDKKDTARKNIADIIVAKHRNGPIGKAELYFDEQRTTYRNLDIRRTETI